MTFLKKIALGLLKNRIAVSCILFLLAFISIPPIMILSGIPEVHDVIGNYQHIGIIFICTYLVLILVWHIASGIIHHKLGLKREAGENYENKNYDDGFETFAAINTLGFSKFINKNVLKAFYGSVAMSIGTLILIDIIITLIDFDLLIKTTEYKYHPELTTLILIIIYYPINRKYLK